MPTQSKTQNLNTQWLRNALKSIGVTASDSIKYVSPNLHEITTSSLTTSRNIVQTLRRTGNQTNQIANALNNNKYMKYAQKAYKNAMADLKSGKINNKEREEQSYFSSGSDSTDGFSFGDDGADDGGTININNGPSTDAILSINSQLQTNAKAQLTMQKASMDAYIAVSSASMQQIGQLGSQIVNQLSNVNSNLSALVQYQNDNMTKFIQASLSYYEKMGASYGDKEKNSNSRIGAHEVIKSGSGGINLAQYRAYVKQNVKKMMANSEIGMLKSIADDPTMMEMLASNPLGFVSQGLASYMMPKVLKTSLESVETALNNYLPNMLSQLGDLTKTEGNTVVAKFRKVVGEVFGLKSGKTDKFDKTEINRGAVAFDGETKHAITEIMTKELRSQTGYLQIIADHYTHGKAKNILDKNAQYWSYSRNQYVNKQGVDEDIANKIVDSIRGAFYDTKFGEAIRNDLVLTRGTEAARKEMQFSVDELFVELEKHKSHLTLNDILTLVDKGGSSKNVKALLKSYFQELSKRNENAFNSVNIGRVNSRGASEEIRRAINEDPTAYNLFNSSFNLSEDSDLTIDDIVAQTLGYGKHSKKRRVKGVADRNGVFDNMDNSTYDVDRSAKINERLKKTAGGISSFIESLITNDIRTLYSKGAATLSDTFVSIAKKINDKSNVEGSFLNQVKNNLTDIGGTIKDGLMLKFFGKTKDQNGKYVKSEDSTGGVFGTIGNRTKDIFTAGINGWTEALVGDEKDPEKARKNYIKDIKEYLVKNAPNGLTGSLVGAGIGMMAHGSVLGAMIGGPMGGAILGATTGFLSKNEKFQKWLFGELNEDGTREGGLVSKDVQEYFKKNKVKLAGGMAGGALVGTVTGGGLLGLLVGGPVAGSIMGLATTVVANSDRFKKFLFGGDGANGQKGLFTAIADAFNKNRKNAANGMKSDGDKIAGMAALGTGAGALSGALISKMGILGASVSPFGPIGGAIMGLGLSIAAQSRNIKEWLFGKKDGLDIGDGRKVKQQGVLGQIGNTLMAGIVNPMKHEIQYIAKDFMNTIFGKVLSPFAAVAEFAAGKLGDVASFITDTVKETSKGVFSLASSTVKSLFAPVTNAIGGIMKGMVDTTWKALKGAISMPGTFAVAVIKGLNIKEKFNELKPVKFFKSLGKDIRNLVFTGVNKLFKLAGNLIAAPFKAVGWLGKKAIDLVSWSGKKFGQGANFVGEKVLGIGAVQSIKNAWDDMKYGNGNNPEGLSLIQRLNRRTREYKEEDTRLKEERDIYKKQDKNARIIAKASKGQFGEDSEEARAWLRINNPKEYKKLENVITTTEAKEAANIVKNGAGTFGKNLSIVDYNKLSEEGKQTKFLFDLREAVTAIANKELGKGDRGESYESDTDRLTREQREARKAREEQERNSDTPISENPSQPSQSNPNLGLKGNAKRFFNNKINGIKNYFSNEFGKNTRNFFGDLKVWYDTGNDNGNYYKREHDGTYTYYDYRNKSLRSGISEQEFSIIKMSSNIIEGKYDDIKKIKNRAINADQVSEQTNTEVEGHSVGGFLKKGFSLVGEKGAELVYKAKNGVARVFSHEDTNAAIDNATGKPNGLFSSLKNKLNFGKSSQDDAVDRALTAKEQREIQEKEQKEKEDKEYKAKLLEYSKTTADTTKEHHGLWNKIFNPKTGLLVVGGLLLYKWFKEKWGDIPDTIKNILGKVATFGIETVKDAIKDIIWTEKHDAREDGNSMSEQAAEIVDDVKDGNFFTDENGEANGRSDTGFRIGARLVNSYITSHHKTPGKGMLSKVRNAEKAVFNGVDKVTVVTGKGVKKVGDFAKNTKVGSAISNAKNSAMNSIKNTGASVASKIKTKAAKNDGLFSKVCGWVEKFYDTLSDKFGKKIGSKMGDLGKVGKKSILKTLKDKWDDICTKISQKLLGKTTQGAVGAVSFGLSEAIMATIGAINGVSGTAKLFQVKHDEVDGTMRLVAGLIGGFAQTTLGGYIDIVMTVVGEIMGTDILHNIAVGLYKMIVGADSEKAKKLESAQEAFKEDYDEYQANEIKKQYETQKNAGIIGSDVSLEDFTKGAHDGTYKVSYDSFEDYNTKQNKSLGDKIAGGVGKAWKTTKKAFKSAKNFLFGGKEEDSFVDKNGNKYKKNEDGTYQVYDKDGNDLGSINADALPEDVTKVEGKKKQGLFGKIKDAVIHPTKIKENLAKARNEIQAKFEKSLPGVAKAYKFLSKHTEKRWHSMEGGYYQSNGDTFDYYNETGSKMAEGITQEEFNELCNSGVVMADESEVVTVDSGIRTKLKDFRTNLINNIGSHFGKAGEAVASIVNKTANVITEITEKGPFKFIGGLFKKNKKEVWYDAQGCYYKLEDNETYSYYNPNNDLITDNIEADKVIEMVKTGLLTKGEIEEDSVAKKGIEKLKDGIKKVWNSVSEKAAKGMGKIMSWLKGDKGGSGPGSKKEDETPYDYYTENGDHMYYGGGHGSRKMIRGGRGPEMVNGSAYYSQNDSRWANSEYNMGLDNATMSDTGCGPTALAMVASNMGRNVNPMDMANLAKATGNRDATGTNWNFVNQASSMIGMPSKQTLSPTARQLDAQLSMGNPVLLSGVGNGGSDPYTKEGHYVVAVGRDKNGNVLVNDPRGKSYSRSYSLNSLASKTGSSWTFMGRGRRGGHGEQYIYDKNNKPIFKYDDETSHATQNPDGSLQYIIDNETGSILYDPKKEVGSSTWKPDTNFVVSTNKITEPGMISLTKEQNKTDKITANNWSKYDMNTTSTSSGNSKKTTSSDNSKKTTDNSFYTHEHVRDIWVKTVSAVKAALCTLMAGQGSQKKYDPTRTINLQIGNVSHTGRLDCTGFITLALKFFGALSKNSGCLNSTTLEESTCPINKYFERMKFPGYDKLEIGDILVQGGKHGEIFASREHKAGTPSNAQVYDIKVWNWGSETSAAEPGVTGSGFYYTHDLTPQYIWRVKNTLPANIKDTAIEGPKDVLTGSDADAVLNNTNLNVIKPNTGDGTRFDKLMSFMGNFFGEFSSRAFSGDWSNTNYDDVVNATLTGDNVTDPSAVNNTNTVLTYSNVYKEAEIDPNASSTNSPTNILSYNKGSLLTTDIKAFPKLTQSQIETILNKNFVHTVNGGTSVFNSSNYKQAAAEIYKAQNETGVSSIVPLSIGAWESGWGTSKIAHDKGNLWGWNATNSNPYGNATVFGKDFYESFSRFTNEYLQTYYNNYGSHSISSTGFGTNPSGKGYAYSDDGKISTTWAGGVAGTGVRMINSINGGSGKGIPKISNRKYQNIVYNSNKLTNKKTGGYGPGIDYSSLSRNMSNTSTNQYRTTGGVNNYITVNKDDNVNKLIMNAIELLAAIAGNTSDASIKLNNLNKLNNLSVNGGNTNVIVGSDGKITSSPINRNNTNINNNKSYTAMQIAKGGY